MPLETSTLQCRINNGDVTNNYGSGDYWIVKLDSNGILEWQKSFGGSNQEEANSITLASDGGILIAGTSESQNGDVTNNHGASDYWVVKLSGEGLIGIEDIPTTAGFSVFPNPAKGSLLVTTTQAQFGTTLTLSDALGREVLLERMNSTTHTLAVGELPRGDYMVTLHSGTRKETQRVVLE